MELVQIYLIKKKLLLLPVGEMNADPDAQPCWKSLKCQSSADSKGHKYYPRFKKFDNPNVYVVGLLCGTDYVFRYCSVEARRLICWFSNKYSEHYKI